MSELEIPCKKIRGTILLGEDIVQHAWNSVEIDGEELNIDISLAIQNRDYKKDPYEYFLIETPELLQKNKIKQKEINFTQQLEK